MMRRFPSVRSNGFYPVLLCLIGFLFSVVFLAPGCDITEDDQTSVDFEYHFHESEHGWEPFFTDYPVGDEVNMEFDSGYRPLPPPLDTSRKALFISAVNRSDDVKMLFRKQVSGLKPNTTYRASFTVRFATAVPSNCAGIGGAPGESVRVLADAHPLKPEPFVDDMEYYRLNIQHLESMDEWYQNRIFGHIANSRDCEEGAEYELKELTTDSGHTAFTSDSEGNAWLFFGTRSGFEGKTDLYYTYFRTELTEE